MLTLDYDIYLFDADETLFDFQKAMRTSLQKAMEQMGIPFQMDFIPVYQRINIGLWKKLENGEISKDELKRQRMAGFLKELSIFADADKLQVFYQKSLNESAYLLPDAFEVMQELSKRKRCFLVTNGFAEAQRGRLKASGMESFFEDIFISEELKTQKPSKEYFNHVFEKIGEEYRTRSIIIGDSLTSDIRGGNNAGIATCWFNPDEKKNTEGVMVSCEIRSLKELL